MGIRKLKLEGFRSIRSSTWEPGKLNVILGPNGSGKSNLLRAIALLRTAATGGLPNEILRLGGIAPLLWDGQAKEITWTVEIDPLDPGLDPARGSLTYELHLQQLGATSTYRIEHEELANHFLKNQGIKDTPKRFLQRNPSRAVVFDSEERRLVAHEGSVPEEETFLSLVTGPFGNSVVLRFKDMLAGWSIFHDIHVDQGATLRQAAIARMEKQVATDGQNLIRVLHTLYTGSRDFKGLVDDAMRAAFGKDYEEIVFPPAADQRIQLRVRWRSLRTEQSAADLSDGTIRFLLLLAILGTPEPGSVIAIDEPEVGLHPSMLPIVAELTTEASLRSQILLTTHSPQLLDAFTATPPTTTVVQSVDGETRLSVVDAVELQRWLKDYTLGALAESGELEGMV